MEENSSELINRLWGYPVSQHHLAVFLRGTDLGWVINIEFGYKLKESHVLNVVADLIGLGCAAEWYMVNDLLLKMAGIRQ